MIKEQIKTSPHSKRKYVDGEYYWVKIKNDGWYTAFYAGEKFGFEICGLSGYEPPEYFERISDDYIQKPTD
jgi:hypothetical protein